MGFSVWFPLEFLNQNNLTYSFRWVYNEGFPTKVFSEKKKLLNHDVLTVELANNFFQSSNMFPLNILFALKSGEIGYQMGGLFPKRKY
jgi:hypothetical protein